MMKKVEKYQTIFLFIYVNLILMSDHPIILRKNLRKEGYEIGTKSIFAFYNVYLDLYPSLFLGEKKIKYC